ncbi:MAG: hypothetical protein JJU36_15165, partial [Phycisphaeraceae bacterium]|nr:hypothetical protein [Phycisphaeraceae bacterium]
MRRPHDPQLETRDALLLGWVEGDLTAEQKSSFEAMCKADPALAKLAEKLKADRLAMRSLPEAKAPEHLWRSALAAADGADSAVDGDLADGAPAPLPMRTHGAPGPGLWLLRGAIAAGLLIASSLVIIHLSGPWGPLNEPMHHSMERRDGEGIAERPDKPAGLTPADRDSIVAHGGGRREAAEEGVAGALTARRDGVDPGALQLADRHDSTHDEGTHGLQEADAAMAFQFGQDRLEGFEADEVELLLAALEDDPVLNAVRFNYFEFDADSQELAQMDDGQFEELPNRITLVVEASDVAATIRQVSAWALDHGGQLLAAREIDVLESEQTRTKLEQVIIQRDQSRFDTPGRGEGIARHQVMPDEAYERRMGLREYENIVPPEEVQRVRGAIERQSGFDSRPQGQAYAR